MVRPRCWVLSAIQVENIVTKKDKKNGGAVRPCALTEENPISCKTVGRKTGRDEKPTLQLKYMSWKAVSDILQHMSEGVDLLR